MDNYKDKALHKKEYEQTVTDKMHEKEERLVKEGKEKRRKQIKLENDLYGNGYDDGYEKGYKHGSYDVNKDLRRIARAIRSVVDEYEKKGYDKTSKLDIVNALRSINEFFNTSVKEN